MAAEVYLVRDGETEWNAQGRYQGKLDSRLTRRGRDQARDAGRQLSAILKGAQRRRLARQSAWTNARDRGDYSQFC